MAKPKKQPEAPASGAGEGRLDAPAPARPGQKPVQEEPVGTPADAVQAVAEKPAPRRGRPRKGSEMRQTRARPEEAEKAIRLLAELVDAFGGSRRHMDKLLGTGRSRTSQVLSGRLDLKFQHILDILEALGIESRAFFEVLYSEEELSPFPGPLAVVYLQKLRASGAPPPAATAS